MDGREEELEANIVGSKMKRTSVGPERNCHENPVGDTVGPHGLPMGPMHGSGQLEGRALLGSLMGLARALVGGAAMLSACIQRHHPHAATLFATKFAFEAGMVIAFDAGLLLNDVLFP